MTKGLTARQEKALKKCQEYVDTLVGMDKIVADKELVLLVMQLKKSNEPRVWKKELPDETVDIS